MCEPGDVRADYLGELAASLRHRGVRCELVTTGYVPRLSLDIPWFFSNEDDQFEDHVLAASEPDGQWRFWWASLQPIAPVTDIERTTDHIYRSTMYLFEPDDDSDAGEPDNLKRPAASGAPQLTGVSGL